MSILVLHRSNVSRRRHLERTAEYAKAAGERLVVLAKNPTWEYDVADAVVTVDTSDVGAALAAVRDLVTTEPEPVRAVAAFVGHSVPAAAAVAAELGLPFVSEHTARTVRDKYAMRKAFGAAGIPQPAHGLARTAQEAQALAARIGFPLVLKPLVDNDTGYLRRVDDHEELAEHFGTIHRGAWAGVADDPLWSWVEESYGRAILVEEYLHGAEVSVESLVWNGKTSVVAIHDKPRASTGPYFTDVCYTTPSRLPEDVRRRIADLAAAANRAVGVDCGAGHTEFRVGEDGEPRILETAARIGGGPIYQSVLLSTGVDMVAAVLDIASGRAPDVSVPADPVPAGFFLFFAERAGRIKAITGEREARLHPRVRELSLYRGVGDEVDVPPRVWQSHGHVVVAADDHDDFDRDFTEIAKSIRLELE